ncbi:molybdopterin cofactor-binding domain-containing protein [Roseisalinus antarcticus]|uniref:Nicotinate dehydrogenase subunit B n=1 Tax=Roseisalinus antarcticus TaxID=254357 RepID=A0A1Y5TJD6_9RHOB|nr:molybdopterin cofactor-binding domain-containing protein [Roseisalinus antarcticus]SLN65366.1 Nicotinate dehydrogenase subunit B [Roseisalinus antarcticus]
MAPINPGLTTAPLVSDWIAAQADGTLSIRSGRSELGQGVLAAFARIAAVELDLPLDRLVICPPDTAAAPNEGFTAGSLSMTQGGKAIRMATSALRTLCLAEAARRLGCAADELAVTAGEILKGGAPTGLSLVALAGETDLRQPVTDHAAPRAAGAHAEVSDHRDLTAQLVGAPFLHDLRMEGMLVGRVLHPPSPQASLAEPLDTEALRARPGVVEVVVNGRFIGLIAESEAAAIKVANWAADRLSWTAQEPPETNVERLFAQSNAPVERLSEDGESLPQGPAQVDLTSRRGFLTHGSIGPSAAIALWSQDALEVWSHTQGVFPLRAAIASVVGLPEDAVRVRHVAGAGCYGHNGADDAALDAALLARAVPGRPVRVLWSRRDEFTVAPLGASMATQARIWTGDDGRMTAMQVSVTSPPHAMRPTSFGAPCLYSAQLLDPPIAMPEPQDLPAERGGGAARNARPLYDLPSVAVDRKLVTGLPWRTSSLRALGAHVNVYAIETALEAAAIAAGADSFAYRRAHLTDPRAIATLDRLEEMSADLRGGGEDQDWGIGLARYKGTAAWAAVLARVTLDDEVRVSDVRVAVDMGEIISRDGAINQIEGGVLQSLSWTLKEKIDLDGARVGTASWADYPILRFSEVPEVTVSLIERPGDMALGCAEAVQGPTAAAVGNAVQRLTGCHIPDLPMRRESLIAALSA